MPLTPEEIKAIASRSAENVLESVKRSETIHKCARCGKYKGINVKWRTVAGLWLCDDCYKLWEHLETPKAVMEGIESSTSASLDTFALGKELTKYVPGFKVEVYEYPTPKFVVEAGVVDDVKKTIKINLWRGAKQEDAAAILAHEYAHIKPGTTVMEKGLREAEVWERGEKLARDWRILPTYMGLAGDLAKFYDESRISPRTSREIKEWLKIKEHTPEVTAFIAAFDRSYAKAFAEISGAPLDHSIGLRGVARELNMDFNSLEFKSQIQRMVDMGAGSPYTFASTREAKDNLLIRMPGVLHEQSIGLARRRPVAIPKAEAGKVAPAPEVTGVQLWDRQMQSNLGTFKTVAEAEKYADQHLRSNWRDWIEIKSTESAIPKAEAGKVLESQFKCKYCGDIAVTFLRGKWTPIVDPLQAEIWASFHVKGKHRELIPELARRRAKWSEIFETPQVALPKTEEAKHNG